MTMRLDLSDSAELQKLVAAAIVQAIDEKKRDALMATAIESLMTPPNHSGYGPKPASPLEAAFREAVGVFAKREAFALLEKNEALQATIRTLLAEAVDRAFVKNRESTVESMAEALVRGMSRE